MTVLSLYVLNSERGSHSPMLSASMSSAFHILLPPSAALARGRTTWAHRRGGGGGTVLARLAARERLVSVSALLHIRSVPPAPMRLRSCHVCAGLGGWMDGWAAEPLDPDPAWILTRPGS